MIEQLYNNENDKKEIFNSNNSTIYDFYDNKFDEKISMNNSIEYKE